MIIGGIIKSFHIAKIWFTLLYISTSKLKPKLTPQESIRFSFN